MIRVLGWLMLLRRSLWGTRTAPMAPDLQFPESAGDLHAARSYSLISPPSQSTWKKSHAIIVEAWVRRTCRQGLWLRFGAGGIRGRLSTRRTVEAPTRIPRPSSSPWIRR